MRVRLRTIVMEVGSIQASMTYVRKWLHELTIEKVMQRDYKQKLP